MPLGCDLTASTPQINGPATTSHVTLTTLAKMNNKVPLCENILPVILR